jgi:hypothetical protein
VTLTGSVTAALMLSQALYWAQRSTSEDGSFYKTMEDWEEETALSRFEQEGARRVLRALGFWHEERRGMPAKLYFRIDLEALEKALSELIAENQQSSMRKTSNHDCYSAANMFAMNQQSNKRTEITTEITTETTTTTPPTPPSAGQPGRPQRQDFARPQTSSARGQLLLSLREQNLEQRFNQRLRAGMRDAAWFEWLDTLIPQYERLGTEFPEAVRQALEALASAGKTSNDHRYFAGVLRKYVPAALRPKPSGPNLTPDAIAAEIARLDAEIEAGRRRLYAGDQYAVS